MNQLKTIADDFLKVYETPKGEKVVNARDLHEQMMIGKDFSTWIKDRIQKYGFIENEDFILTITKTGERKNVIRYEYLLTLDTAKEIAMVQNNEQGRAIRKYFIEVEKRFSNQNKPQSVEDLIIMQANSMKELRQEVDTTKKELTTVKHRLDNYDNLDTIGDLQQRFNKMIKRFAWDNGFNMSKAWKSFDQAYNTAFRTNLTAKRNNYCDKHGLKSLSRPQYLSVTNQLEDAVRVAEKMLNQTREDAM
ncbi:antA/AntB antirepressor family protein [Paraliobacillus ryukyuensis]|uniref:antA/AntB antirepressor family protein n=1 Tax=Paraliobacillus ryukyuensis TaxID=200904 RepID=UPI0009A76A31|nr:antA/AntB antirepressor family protein [Paraliobacillus ryukyuensis]